MPNDTLFSELTIAVQPAAPPALPASRGVQLATLPTSTALVRQQGASTNWFDWTANPYRGCELACNYCYARSSHAWLGHADPRDFERQIYVKEGFAEAFRRDLRTRVRPGEHIAFGTATDPYQPIERREGIMQSVLRELSYASRLRISITTKSSLVTRDIDLLIAIARRNDVHVNVTITTPDSRLARFLEPRAPAPSTRFETIRTLRAAGIRTGVFLMPVLPGITDSDADLRILLRHATSAGAQYLAHSVVFLEGTSRAHFLASLRRAYPRVAARYEVWTRSGRNLPLDLRNEVAGRVHTLAREHGLPGTSGAPGTASRTATQQVFAFAG
jgi:DNA repair photolyase